MEVYYTSRQARSRIVDTYWQTENGGFLCSTKPALDPMKPGSAGPGVPASTHHLDEEGRK